MISKRSDDFLDLKRGISRQKKIVGELNSLMKGIDKVQDEREKQAIKSQINLLRIYLRKDGEKVLNLTKQLSLTKSLNSKEDFTPREKETKKEKSKRGSILDKKEVQRLVKKEEDTTLEKIILRRIGKKREKKKKIKERKPNPYIGFASKIFSDYSRKVINKGTFETMRMDLIKANLRIVPTGYISVIFMTTIIAAIIGFFVFLFFLLFEISATPPFIALSQEGLGARFLKFFIILFLFPGITFIFLYLYPSLEKRSNENFINREIPFATIHMSAISGSLIDPTKIFSIIVTTGEYPHIEKEFKKLLNEINIYGYDLVTALRNAAFRSSSKKLADLYNGLSTTITSGGDLSEFFDKRAESLLLEHRLEREKYTKTTETFMDIYISVVIAAPMILMLLLMMMQISGIGVTLSPGMISLVMVLGVSVINIFFLTFLHLKQPGE